MHDLHCHLLPAIDDGAIDLAMALEMARIAADDGIRTIACTPHIYPGMYDNDSARIAAAIAQLQGELDQAGITLKLVAGADVHLVPEVPAGVREGRIPTLAGSRYLLLEPSHHIAPPRFEDSVFTLMAMGLVPVITHPERLTWVEDHYDVFVRMSQRGAWMQVTAGALTGRFGKRAGYWAERFVGEGHCHLLATDAHHPKRRPPLLAEGRHAAARLLGEEEAGHLVETRPAGVLANAAPDSLPPLPVQQGCQRAGATGKPGKSGTWLDRLLRARP